MRTLTEVFLEKSRRGTYKDNAENRRKHRVGMPYGKWKEGTEAYIGKVVSNYDSFGASITVVCTASACISSPINLKSRESIQRKMTKDGCTVHEIKDIMRNTFVAVNGNIDEVINTVKGHFNVLRHKVQKPEDFDGYSGNILNIKFPNGAIGEVQVNTPEMIYAKEPAKVARELLGEELYGMIDAAAKKIGFEGGRGHLLYEQIRQMEPSEERQALKQESVEYYSRVKEILI